MGCGHRQVGHGDSVVCGQDYSGEVWLCRGCRHSAAEIESLRAQLEEADKRERANFSAFRKVVEERDEARARLQFIQDEVETLELTDWSDDVQDGRAWTINGDQYPTDNLNDAIDAAREGE